MRKITDYYYGNYYYVTVRIMGDDCEICQREETKYFWSVVKTPKIYICKGDNKYIPVDVRSTSVIKMDNLKTYCDCCKLYDEFVIPIPEKEDFDPSKLRLIKMGNGYSMGLIKYGNMELMSDGYSQGFF